jgi:hypothetical protein
MAAVCRSYASHDEAAKAVVAVLGAGVDGRDVLVLTGEGVRDVREQPAGSFAGTVDPGDPVGSFEGERHARAEPKGTFADEPSGRVGSFADAAREELTSYPHGVERMHAIGHASVLRLLRGAGLDEATAERDLDALHSGRVLLLVEHAEGEAGRVASLLDAT